MQLVKLCWTDCGTFLLGSRQDIVAQDMSHKSFHMARSIKEWGGGTTCAIPSSTAKRIVRLRTQMTNSCLSTCFQQGVFYIPAQQSRAADKPLLLLLVLLSHCSHISHHQPYPQDHPAQFVLMFWRMFPFEQSRQLYEALSASPL